MEARIFVAREDLSLKGRIPATGGWDGSLQRGGIADRPLQPPGSLPAASAQGVCTGAGQMRHR